jgi:hypothetical protein
MINLVDHALTRPWTVDKTYQHNPDPRPNWLEQICAGAQRQHRRRQGKLFPEYRWLT